LRSDLRFWGGFLIMSLDTRMTPRLPTWAVVPLLITGVLLATGLLLVVVLSTRGPDPERREQEQKLKALISRRASQDEITADLGKNFIYYEKGVTNWEYLEAVLKARSDIAQQVGTSSRVLYYTTENFMTWIVLDDQSRITNYYLCSQ